MALNLVGGREICNGHVCSPVPAYAFTCMFFSPGMNLFHDSDAKITTKRNLLQEVRGNGWPCPSMFNSAR